MGSVLELGWASFLQGRKPKPQKNQKGMQDLTKGKMQVAWGTVTLQTRQGQLPSKGAGRWEQTEQRTHCFAGAADAMMWMLRCILVTFDLALSSQVCRYFLSEESCSCKAPLLPPPYSVFFSSPEKRNGCQPPPSPGPGEWGRSLVSHHHSVSSLCTPSCVLDLKRTCCLL